jgi:hypothetical protein
VLLLLNTAHRHSDFGALSPFLLPTFLNPPALPTQSLKRLLNSVAAEDGFLFKRPNTFLFFDYPDAMGTAINGINNQDLVVRSLHGFCEHSSRIYCTCSWHVELTRNLNCVAGVIFLFAPLLYPQLDFADVQSRTDSGVLSRDMIVYNNNRSLDFLKDIDDLYRSRQIVF